MQLRGAKIGAYTYYTWDRTRTVFCSGSFHSQTLTALDELAAPKLWTLPGDIQNPMRAQFYELCGSYSWPEKYAAQDWLRSSTQQLVDARLNLAYDHDQIRLKATQYADICARISTDAGLEAFCNAVYVEPPGKKNTSEDGRLRRARVIAWWTRRLFKRYSRSAENALRLAGFIGRKKNLYSSSVACRARQRRAEIFRTWLDKMVVCSDMGDCVSLRRLYDGSLANPVNRRNELMTRLRGMGELADSAGLVADFITLTLPSKYHAVLHHGDVNPRYNGATVRAGQLQLRRLWSKFRARAAKKEIFYYGMRVAEPHHDGTPHWHMVLYSMADNRDELQRMLRELWLSEDGNEPGAAEHRVRILACDRTIGTVAGYLAKYIAKNVDGFDVGADFEADGAESFSVDGAETGEQIPAEMDGKETSKRALTWAWLHGIRQFQFFGTARVGLWRELRRVREPITESAEIEAARLAADAGEWARFVDCIGGVFVGASTSLNLWKRITDGKKNQYDEDAGPQIVGIESPDGYYLTRLKVWRLERAVTVSDTGPREDEDGAGNPIGWSNPQETSMYGPH